jgi:hypothetical protein
MPVQITPEPDDAERQAILAALAAEEDERGTVSKWAATALPGRDSEESEP